MDEGGCEQWRWWIYNKLERFRTGKQSKNKNTHDSNVGLKWWATSRLRRWMQVCRDNSNRDIAFSQQVHWQLSTFRFHFHLDCSSEYFPIIACSHPVGTAVLFCIYTDRVALVSLTGKISLGLLQWIPPHHLLTFLLWIKQLFRTSCFPTSATPDVCVSTHFSF